MKTFQYNHHTMTITGYLLTVISTAAVCAPVAYAVIGIGSYERRRAHNVYNAVCWAERAWKHPVPVQGTPCRADMIADICNVAAPTSEAAEALNWHRYPLPAIEGRVETREVRFAINGVSWEVTPDRVTVHGLLGDYHYPINPSS